MGRGRKKLPEAIQDLVGRRAGKPGYGDSPIVPRGFPACPRELTGDARKEWKRLRKLLQNARLITPADRAALMGYCFAFGRMVEAEKHVAQHGMIIITGRTTTKDAKTGKTTKTGGNLVQNPYLSVANRATELMRKFIADLGLSPTSRGGLRIPLSVPAEPGKTGDDIESILDGEDDPEPKGATP